jgi:hypothetical protein
MADNTEKTSTPDYTMGYEKVLWSVSVDLPLRQKPLI